MSPASLAGVIVIEPDAMYPITEAQRITGWKKAAWRELLKEGLQVRYLGGRGYVRGCALIEHIDTHGKLHGE